MFEIVFWQRIVSPHLACLATEVANLGHELRYVAGEPMSKDRVAQGWTPPDMKNVQLDYIADLTQVDAVLKDLSPDAVHIVQGIRGNGYVGHVIKRLRQRQARWGVLMETVKEPVLSGMIKRLIYQWQLGRSFHKPDFVLAIGEKTPSWVAARKYPKEQIYPFTYFLESGGMAENNNNRDADSFRVGFVGQLVSRKRVDILIDSLALESFCGLELVIVGSGPLEAELKTMAQKKLSHLKLHWLGQLPMAKARSAIAALDCLVLPSSHDGWGAVVSEALIAGVPAICSDACGAAVVVRASGVGGIFPSGDALALRQLLIQIKTKGHAGNGGNGGNDVRQRLAEWATCLDVTAGAGYLDRILESIYNGGAKPSPPWASFNCS